MRYEDDPTTPKGVPRRGQMLFASVFGAFAVFLAVSYPGQTAWVEKTKTAAQPGFWPLIGVGGMVLFTGLHILRLNSRRLRRPDWAEGRRWTGALEFCVWFLAYVFLVPVIGYVFASALFVPALTWRMGYRSGFMLWVSLGFALAVVVVFKAFLEVKIPGGAFYDYFPAALRSFFILNL
ncbi:MAG: tripartite tricarboxylate transporter TctB family protein [Rhodobacter sp.]|nr:tripartite tricarboxylate transporter TctB family protein [Rhodobacter sp.]